MTQVPPGPSQLQIWSPQPMLTAFTVGWVLQKQACHLEAQNVIPKMPLLGSYQVVQELLTPCRSPTAFPSCCDVRLAAPAAEIPP